MNCWIQAYLQGMKQSRDGSFLFKKKGLGETAGLFLFQEGGLKSFRLGSTTLDMLYAFHRTESLDGGARITCRFLSY